MSLVSLRQMNLQRDTRRGWTSDVLIKLVLPIALICSAWFEHHPELQPWFRGWPYCRYDAATGMCIDEFGDQQKCGDALFIEESK